VDRPKTALARRPTVRRNPIVSFLLVLVSVSAAALAGPSVASARCRAADSIPSRAHSAAVSRSVLCLLNRERARHGLRRLHSDRRLRRAAARHSNHMTRAHFFDHTTPAGTSMSARILHTGYTRGSRAWAIGENIAWGSGGLASPRRIVQAWMASPGHRANILDGRYREIGVGIAFGAPVRVAASASGATFTTDFGMRR